jgi:hypothetical protein
VSGISKKNQKRKEKEKKMPNRRPKRKEKEGTRLPDDQNETKYESIASHWGFSKTVFFPLLRLGKDDAEPLT